MSAVESKKTSELKDRKVGLSCAECRRSKLKCDRVFPCQSCIRRGCAHLCPDGVLTATKGNRVLIAHAQKLTEQVKSMSARIQELEKALQQSCSLAGDTVHPLLCQTEEPPPWEATVRDVSDAIGSLSIGMEGQAKHHGRSAGSEYFYNLLAIDENDLLQQDLSDLPFEIVELMNSFPFGLKDCPYTKHIFVPFLPTRERTMHLVDLYYIHVAWMYDPIVKDDFMNAILDPIYGTMGFASLHTLHPHRLSVFFILLANGIRYDDECPSASVQAEYYHALSRAAFALDSVLNESTCAAVQALFMMYLYIYSSDRTSNETRWLLSGLCCRVAQTIGLERDSAGWGLEPEEVQRRRIMFWELYTYDAWTSLVNGRPPALNIQYIDCRFPADLDPPMEGGREWGWHAWKFRYSASCLSISVHHTFSTRVPQYSALLELDKKIRKFPLPQHLQGPLQASDTNRTWSSDPSRAMQQYCAICERESNLLYVHRSYFAQAIREQSQNPLQHQYAPSVLATYRSACRLLSSLKGLYAVHRAMTSRVWFFWSGIFSSGIVLGALVVESPSCTLARNALHELEQALPFYEEGSQPCRPPATLTMLRKLYQRAQSAYTAFHTGVANTGASLHKVSDAPMSADELEILGGRKSVISSKSSSNTPSSRSGSSQDSRRSMRASSDDSAVGSQSDKGDMSMVYGDIDSLGPEQTATYDPGFLEIGSYFVDSEESKPGMFQGYQVTNPPAFGYDSQVFMGAQGYVNPGGVEYPYAQPLPGVMQHHTGVGSLARVGANPGRGGSPYAATPIHQQTNTLYSEDARMLGGHQQTQEEIWRHFVNQLGLRGGGP